MTQYIIGTLALVALVGVIVLSILHQGTQDILPILTILVGYLVGKNQSQILGYIKGKK